MSPPHPQWRTLPVLDLFRRKKLRSDTFWTALVSAVTLFLMKHTKGLKLPDLRYQFQFHSCGLSVIFSHQMVGSPFCNIHVKMLHNTQYFSPPPPINQGLGRHFFEEYIHLLSKHWLHPYYKLLNFRFPGHFIVCRFCCLNSIPFLFQKYVLFFRTQI